ncbi:DUF294 nucleotidyltransferase-like domain-containing protein [Fredinandcohnia sp. 179-A 10B2 NHS]|uniref:DUF294 nucleotidyltransferase-like domain-containing protein n=1 Tax=Fredinandcohnia sp. 179-A 10B2 NHS TaxID=3235176 RepID=UPI0039A23838
MEQLYDLVKNHPFFQELSKNEILSLLSLCYPKGYIRSDIIFHANEQREGVLLLLSGCAEVYVGEQDNPEVLEIVNPGELIGLSSIADLLGTPHRENEYTVEVKATESVQCLLIPNQVIKQRLHSQTFHHYLLTQLAVRLKDIYGSLAEQVALTRKGRENGSFTRRVQDIMTQDIISVEPYANITAAAKLMTTNRTSSVLVIESTKLQGIITERDLVARVIQEQLNLNVPVKEIMTRNPITISRYAYYYEALSTFILHGVKHLPVVEGENVVGIITLSDVMRRKNDNMLKTIRAIETTNEETLPSIKLAIYDVVDALLHDDVPIFRLLDSVTKLYDRLVKRCIDMAIEEISKKEGLLPPVAFCFYQMGSAGREEQFLLTDQDHFLIYENTEDTEVEEYFRKLSEEIVRLLEKAGYARCKGDMMASNPRWRGGIDTWMGRVHSWSINATNQNMLLAQNFFSYRFLYGNESLHNQFEGRLQEELQNAKIFLFRLHEQEKENQIPTLGHPIRALFKLDRKQLEIKKEILFPYHHSLQLLSLVHGIFSGTPFERVDKLVDKKAFDEKFAKDIKAAISEVIGFYVRQRWKQYKNKEELTSVLHFSKLTTKEKEELILSARILKEIQSLVSSHF